MRERNAESAVSTRLVFIEGSFDGIGGTQHFIQARLALLNMGRGHGELCMCFTLYSMFPLVFSVFFSRSFNMGIMHR